MNAALKGVLVVTALLLYAFASHTLFTQVDRYARLAILWVWLPLAGACVLMSWGNAWRWPVLVALAATSALVWQWSASVAVEPGLLFMIQYVAIQAGLAGLFGATLRPGHQPLVTRLARAVHGELPPEIVRYTRSVTKVWTAFFVAMGSVATLLYLAASVQWWSVWVNFLTPLMVGALFAVEYLVRRRSFPDFEHSSFMAAVRAFQHDFERRKAD